MKDAYHSMLRGARGKEPQTGMLNSIVFHKISIRIVRFRGYICHDLEGA